MTDRYHCPAPWTGAYFTNQGHGVCCGYLPREAGVTPLQFVNSDTVKQIRRGMMSGDLPQGCETKCRSYEAQGFYSIRNHFIDFQQRHQIPTYQDPDVDVAVRDVEVRFGNLCNFKCRICTAQWSSSIDHEVQQHPEIRKWMGINDTANEIKEQEMYHDLCHMLPDMRRLYLTGGEPTISKAALQLVSTAVDQGHCEHIVFQFATNTSVINDRFLKDITRFQESYVVLSIDAVGPAAEYQRHGTQWTRVLENIHAYGSMIKHNANVFGTMHSVITAYTVLDIHNLIKLWMELEDLYGITLNITLIGEPHLSAMALQGTARQMAIQQLDTALDLLQQALERKSGHDSYQRTCAALENLRHQLLTQSADPSLNDQFQEFTRAFDSVRGENFAATFGVDLS